MKIAPWENLILWAKVPQNSLQFGAKEQNRREDKKGSNPCKHIFCSNKNYKIYKFPTWRAGTNSPHFTAETNLEDFSEWNIWRAYPDKWHINSYFLIGDKTYPNTRNQGKEWNVLKKDACTDLKKNLRQIKWVIIHMVRIKVIMWILAVNMLCWERAQRSIFFHPFGRSFGVDCIVIFSQGC